MIKTSLTPEGDGGGSARARALAATLALGCLAWLPFRLGWFSAGAAAPMFETLFTLVFVASAVYLAAGSAAMGDTGGRLARAGLVLSPLLLAMYARNWFPDLGWPYLVVPVLGAVVLAATSRVDWRVLRVAPA